jgi:hypothetical protein
MKITVFAVAMLVILLVAAPAFAYSIASDFDFSSAAAGGSQGPWSLGYLSGTSFTTYNTYLTGSGGPGQNVVLWIDPSMGQNGNVSKSMGPNDVIAWTSWRRVGWVGFQAGAQNELGWGGMIRFAPGAGTFDYDIYFENRDTYTSGNEPVRVTVGTVSGGVWNLIGEQVIYDLYCTDYPKTYEVTGQVTLGANDALYFGAGSSLGMSQGYTEVSAVIQAVPEPTGLVTLLGLFLIAPSP